MHVTLGGRDPRVPEELLHEARVGVPGDEAPGGVAQGMEAQRAQAGGVACGLEAAAHGRWVEPPAEARAEDVVIARGVIATRPQAFQGFCGGVGERQEARLSALCRPLHAGGHGAVDDHPPCVEVDVLPAQRHQLAEAQAGVGGETEQLAVLRVLACPPLPGKTRHRGGDRARRIALDHQSRPLGGTDPTTAIIACKSAGFDGAARCLMEHFGGCFWASVPNAVPINCSAGGFDGSLRCLLALRILCLCGGVAARPWRCAGRSGCCCCWRCSSCATRGQAGEAGSRTLTPSCSRGPVGKAQPRVRLDSKRFPRTP
jgi:hypothetical protein